MTTEPLEVFEAVSYSPVTAAGSELKAVLHTFFPTAKLASVLTDLSSVPLTSACLSAVISLNIFSPTEKPISLIPL